MKGNKRIKVFLVLLFLKTYNNDYIVIHLSDDLSGCSCL